jgi:hypothetical protein
MIHWQVISVFPIIKASSLGKKKRIHLGMNDVPAAFALAPSGNFFSSFPREG